MMERALIDIIQQCLFNIILAHKKDEYAKSTRSMNALTGQVRENMSFISSILTSVRNILIEY